MGQHSTLGIVFILLIILSGCKQHESQSPTETQKKSKTQDEDYIAARMYEKGDGVEVNILRAIELYEKSANRGNSDAQYNLGRLYGKDGGTGIIDYAKSRYWLSKSAEQNDVDALFGLAVLMANGLGGEVEENKSIELLNNAANLGHLESQKHLARIYREVGIEIVKQDFKKSIYWYTKAADQGDLESQKILAGLYEFAPGGIVNKDIESAVYWHTKAGEQNDLESQKVLGDLYEEGVQDFLSPDSTKAIYWYTKASEQGDLNSLLRLSIMHVYKTDLDVAEKWCNEADKLVAKDDRVSLDVISAVREVIKTTREVDRLETKALLIKLEMLKTLLID